MTADPAKGVIELYRDPDQMMYFVWRNRTTNSISPNDELVVVSGDYTWKRVHQCKLVWPDESPCPIVVAIVHSF